VTTRTFRIKARRFSLDTLLLQAKYRVLIYTSTRLGSKQECPIPRRASRVEEIVGKRSTTATRVWTKESLPAEIGAILEGERWGSDRGVVKRIRVSEEYTNEGTIRPSHKTPECEMGTTRRDVSGTARPGEWYTRLRLSNADAHLTPSI